MGQMYPSDAAADLEDRVVDSSRGASVDTRLAAIAFILVRRLMYGSQPNAARGPCRSEFLASYDPDGRKGEEANGRAAYQF